ncbi:MAG: DUF2779 domain-containing protein, partial [Planctomycetota bacterium]
MRGMTKRLFLDSLACETLGWRERHDAGSTELGSFDQYIVDQGVEVGARARLLFPDGVLVDSPDETSRRLADTDTLFEAWFEWEGCAARADVLVRGESGWRLIEVKSGVNERDDRVDDLAYTLMVAEGAGISVESAELMLVSRDYRLGMEDSDFFQSVDLTDDARERAAGFAQVARGLVRRTGADTCPDGELIPACRNCPYFASDCVGRGIDNHIFDFPRLSKKKLEQLAGAGTVSIESVPDDFALTEKQARVRAAVIAGEPQVSDSLRADLESIRWPALYLDFETVMTAVPLFPDTAPYAQVPIQYSIDVCDRPGNVIDHREYLADADRDCRRELAERLLEHLDGDGSIVAYSPFEKTVLHGLATTFPDLGDALRARVVLLHDLCATIGSGYYHPDFHGSFSIKKTLPVLVPDMTYEGLAIGDGGAAMAAFARMARGE